MKRAATILVSVLAACLLLSLPALAHSPQQAPHQSYGEGDLKLESGESIKDFSISFVTHGTLNAKKSNAILMVSAVGGNHHRIDFLIGPGKALDPDKYFIICTDAIANGLTTSPSNSKAQPRMSFPRFTIRDMVETEHALLTRVLGLSHVKAVVGISMGGMQTFQWVLSYPNFMDRAIPIVGSPQLAPYDLLLWQACLDAIQKDPEWKNGDYRQEPVLPAVQELADLALTTPEQYNQNTTRKAFFESIGKRTVPVFGAVKEK